jgi:maltose-binding protein MalE
MKRNIVRIAAILICLSTVLALAVGCTPAATATPVPPTATSAPVKEYITTDTGYKMPKLTLTDEEKTIKLINGWGGQFDPAATDGSNVVVLLFDKYYGGKIELDLTANNDITAKLAALVAAGTPPDVVNMPNGSFPASVVADIVQPVDGLIDFDYDYMKRLESAYDQFAFNGKHYFMPWVVDVMDYVFYNTKIFEDNGMDTPWDMYKAGTWDWNAFKKLATDLNVDDNADGTAERWGAGLCVWHDARLAFSSGQNIAKVDGTSITSNLSNAALEKGFTWFTDLILKDKTVDPSDDPNHLVDVFNQGKMAMLMGPDFWNGTDAMFPDLKANKQLGFAPTPKDPNADKLYVCGEYIGFFFPKGATNKNGLTAFLYSCIVAQDELTLPTSEAAIKAKENFLTKWPMYTSEEIDAMGAKSKEINALPQVLDVFVGFLDIYQLKSLMVGAGGTTPLSYAQAVAQLEPVMLDNISKALNPVSPTPTVEATATPAA